MNKSSSGMDFASVFLIVFVVLKLVGIINWSWWWVLSPLWIGIILWLIVVICCAVWVTRTESKFTKRRKDKWRF